MIRTNTHQKIDLKYILIVLCAVFFSTLFHELAHWSVGEILGNDMHASLNSAGPISGNYI